MPINLALRKSAQGVPGGQIGQVPQIVQGGEQTRALHAQDAGDENELHRFVPVLQRAVESAQVPLGFLLRRDRKGGFGPHAGQRRVVLVDQHRELAVATVEVRKQAVQGAPGRDLRCGFRSERQGEFAYQARHFIPDFGRRIALYPRHVQDQRGDARHLRQIA